MQDVEEIYQIMKTVYNCLEDKTTFVCDDLEFVKRHIGEEGFIVIACTKSGKIIACLICRYPLGNKDNLGIDIKLSPDQLEKVVHMESAVVLPEYRGQGLQQQLLQFAEKNIDKKYMYCLTTVSPDNAASCRAVEKSGYQFRLSKLKYGNLQRRIYMKNINFKENTA